MQAARRITSPPRVALFLLLMLALELFVFLYHLLLIDIPSWLSPAFRRRHHHSRWNWLIAFWGRGIWRIACSTMGLSLEVEGRVPPGRHIVVTNHQSTADILLLFELLSETNVKFVVKKELLRHVPNVSKALREGGFGVVDFSNRRTTIRGLIEFARSLEEWDGSPLIFPEGERTFDGSIAPFRKTGLLLLARETGLPILPVVIDGLWPARSLGRFFLHLPDSRIRVRVLPPVAATRSGRSEDRGTVDELPERLERSMRLELEAMRRASGRPARDASAGGGPRADSPNALPAPLAGRRSVADHLEVALLALVGYGCHLYYNLVGHLASLRGQDFGPLLITPVDRACPYMPVWAPFYAVAYVAPLIVLVLIAWKIGSDVPVFRRMVVVFLAMLAVHYTIYLLVPTSARAIRLPDSALGDGVLAGVVRSQYHLATVWCAWPSLHVSACWFFYRLLARYHPIARWIYLVWFAGMYLGTFAIKIHYVLDGATGLLLAESFYRFVLRPLERRDALRWERRPRPVRLAALLTIAAVVLGSLPLAMRASGYVGPLYTISVGR